AHDLAVLGAAAIQNPALAAVMGTTTREVAGPPGRPPHRLRNLLSQLWTYPGAIGGKTGWTERAGQVRVVVAQRAGTRLVAVVMDSPDNVPEVRDLFDYGFTIDTRDTKSDPSGPPQVPLSAEAFPLPDASLAQAWQAY